MKTQLECGSKAPCILQASAICGLECLPSHSDHRFPLTTPELSLHTWLDQLRYRRPQELLWVHSVISRLFCVWTYFNTTSHATSCSTSTLKSLSAITKMERGSSSKTLLAVHHLHGVTHQRTYFSLSMEPQTWNTVLSPTYINKLSQNTQHEFLPQKHSFSSFNHIFWKASTANVKILKFQ